MVVMDENGYDLFPHEGLEIILGPKLSCPQLVGVLCSFISFY